MMEILQIWKKKQITNNYESLFPMINLAEHQTFMSEYFDESRTEFYDHDTILKFGSWYFRNVFGGDDVEHFDKAWKGFILNNAENFQRIFNTLIKEYDPLANYDKNSTITTDYEGKETNSTGYNGTETVNYTNPADGYEDTTEKYVSPENNETFYSSDKMVNKMGHRDDNTTRSFDGREDTTEKTFDGRKDTVTEHTSGNIGTTRTQDMLADEVKVRISMSFYPMIFEKFIKEYCIL